MVAGGWASRVLCCPVFWYTALQVRHVWVLKKRCNRKALRVIDGGLTINLHLFATLAVHMPKDAAHFPIGAGMTVNRLLEQLGVPVSDVKLIFINSLKGSLDSRLYGGERVGIFPPVGGG
jgi:sulfur-carrier protein